MFNCRFGPASPPSSTSLHETEADGGWTTKARSGRPGPGVSVSFGPGLGVFGDTRQQMMFNAFQPHVLFRTVFYPEPRTPREFGAVDSDLGSMDPSPREESVMSALQRWRDVSDPHGGARGEVREEEEEGGVRAMEVNREALARAG